MRIVRISQGNKLELEVTNAALQFGDGDVLLVRPKEFLERHE